jgi:four helix bundle protein
VKLKYIETLDLELAKFCFFCKKYTYWLVSKEEKYRLVQINRCAVSPSNIAEGCRTSQKRFFQISNKLRFGLELETQIEIAKEVGFVNVTSYLEITSLM